MDRRTGRMKKCLVLASAVTVFGAVLVGFWAPPALAAVNCYAEAQVSRPSTSVGKAQARAYCDETVFELHVYARFYRADTTPATSLAGNSNTCELNSICPANNGWVSVTHGLVAGCHNYQARTGGYWEPLGMPVQLPYTTIYNSAIFRWCS
jgi:hypothetical protein